MRPGALLATGVLLAVLLVAPATAYPAYLEQIPSVPVVDGSSWPGVGHIRSAGGGARNTFGVAFAKAGYKWTPALCKADSDGDGFTNGVELGDPQCKWVAGKPKLKALSHPGLGNSKPAGAGKK